MGLYHIPVYAVLCFTSPYSVIVNENPKYKAVLIDELNDYLEKQNEERVIPVDQQAKILQFLLDNSKESDVYLHLESNKHYSSKEKKYNSNTEIKTITLNKGLQTKKPFGKERKLLLYGSAIILIIIIFAYQNYLHKLESDSVSPRNKQEANIAPKNGNENWEFIMSLFESIAKQEPIMPQVQSNPNQDSKEGTAREQVEMIDKVEQL